MAYPDSARGYPTPPRKFSTRWLQDIVAQLTGVADLSATPFYDLNEIANIYGVQPVVFTTSITRPVAISNASNTDIRKSLINRNTGATAVNDATTVYTVSTGKTFYCTMISLGVGVAGAASIVQLTIGASVFAVAPVQALGGNVVMHATDIPLFVANGGSAIKVTGGGAGNNIASIAGFEQ